ncbi:DUF4160 domain-containing protein [Pseudoalteromonas luteoviolacea]|uniref:DUF4160 domain-containing protein n=1 Tax=Pseudoalteromonas luteoviolacea TaxID=43657 RepID=UPI000A3FD65C|nr:DUF4160 domain-containing protein [Pseudoalteromonas luteoviolacea]
MTLPSGGTIEYDYKVFNKLRNDPYNENRKLHTKTINDGNGNTDTWTFDYKDTRYSAKDALEVTIERTDETVKKIFSDDKSYQHGQLLEETVTDTALSKEKKVRYEYKLIADIGEFTFLDFPEDVPASLTSKVALKKKTVSIDGNHYYTEYQEHNAYGMPTKIKESFNQKHKYTKLGYYNNSSKWILGLPTTVSVSTYNGGYTTVSETKYNGLGLPNETKKFGTWVTRYTKYSSKGDLEKEEYNAPRTFGTGNRFTQFSSYENGKPGTITVPAPQTSSNMSRTQSFDAYGRVKRETDYKGTTTNYYYGSDVTGINIESDSTYGDWQDTFIEWNDARTTRTISRCKLNRHATGCDGGVVFKTVETYDGLTRLIKTATHDDTGSNRISRYQEFGYNKNHQLTFESFFSGSSNTITSGTTTTYDAFGRKLSMSTTGRGSITYDYLSGNRVKVTDAGKNSNNTTHSTTTTYQAYGMPDYSMATKIESPENVTTDIGVDVFGIINSVSQTGKKKDGVFHTVTERREYTAAKHLCLVTRPELGTTIYGRNNFGEQTWSKSGVTNTECTTDKPSSPINYTYDNLGNLRTVDYADNSGDATYTRDKNGNITTLTAGNVNHAYNYNNQNLLEDETVTVGTNLPLQTDYEYNSLQHLSYTTYPDVIGVTLSHKPNGFGEPTEARVYNSNGSVKLDFAHSATYHANGLLKGFTYGNGVKHSMTLHNTSELPETLKDYKTSSNIVNLRYGFDNNANVTSITNNVDSGYSLSSLTYDGLNRLKSTTGGTKIGSSSLSYDGFGNITSYSSLGRNLGYSYDYNKNRLSSVSGVSGKYSRFSYDTKGNVTNNGSFGLTFNQANQVASANGHTYNYDGHDRRVYQSDNGGSYSVYTQDGTLIYREEGTSIAEEGGVTIEHYYKGNDHAPAHIHVNGGGGKTKIGQNGKPIKGSPELTSKQRKVVEANKAKIRRAVKKIGKVLQDRHKNG